MTSAEVRSRLVDALRLDLVGPAAGHALENERLSQAPSRWYLTGFLVPKGASEHQRIDEQGTEAIAEETLFANADDAAAPEPSAARRAALPSSMGLSVLVLPEARTLRVTVEWGQYERIETAARSKATEEAGEPEAAEQATIAEEATTAAGTAAPSGTEGPDRPPRTLWRRRPERREVELPLPERTPRPQTIVVPESGGLELALSVRRVRTDLMAGHDMPEGVRSASVVLVNGRRPAPDETRDEAFVFQAELALACEAPFAARPNLSGLSSEDWDDRLADLQYRDACEYAVGHGVATEARPDADGLCRSVRTTWVPQAEVERVAPAAIEGVELSMETLAALSDSDEARLRLQPMVAHYREWIARQTAVRGIDHPRRVEMKVSILEQAGIIANRLEQGIACLAEPDVRRAFQIANRAMAMQARRRAAIQQQKEPEAVAPPEWRPFQLAFLLMNLPGLADPLEPNRETVDLLFFPTGGGKTEAYLGLAAFTLVLRRLRHPGLASAGVAVIMRYTLRLLTLDQLTRAAALICALELLRAGDPDLGPWPFEIGLWVGQAATPNRMGSKRDDNPESARSKTIAFSGDDKRPSPIPLEECPWCGTKFSRNSFQLKPSPDAPIDLVVNCVSRRCEFSGGRSLPLVGVDEPIYRRLPCFLIATVDKFAGLPWIGEAGGFFGRVDRADGNGFYGPCAPHRGRPLEGGRLLPPELIIQDELHLISGPLGTVAGLYETAIDELCRREVDGRTVRPKIVASTATVRRADRQIRALFGRPRVDVFPPPGPDRRDSFFAVTHDRDTSRPRLYLGIAAQGRSLKVILLRSYLALLGAAQSCWVEAGGARAEENPADPYMTLVGYFNSLRELGGSRRIVEDEVSTRLAGYGGRRREGEERGLFTGRRIAYEVVELTSRVGTDKVAEARRRLGLPFREDGHVDVAIATNMISVGLDILRLGLMVVLGQPKTTAEYIQATSRVGRDPQRPGLVVTLMNLHRPRDRSHYERFGAFHASFYRGVEAASVTPFSPRALDRALAGAVVALVRHGLDAMTPPAGALAIDGERGKLDFAVRAMESRAAGHDARSDAGRRQELQHRVHDRVADLLDSWERIAHDQRKVGASLQYQHEVSQGMPLLRYPLDPELPSLTAAQRKFRAARSMRDVEAEVNLWMQVFGAPDDGDADGTGGDGTVSDGNATDDGEPGGDGAVNGAAGRDGGRP